MTSADTHAFDSFISSCGATLLPVRPGAFRMGSPDSEPGHRFWEQQHNVTLRDAFYMSRTPVTQLQYETVTDENPTDHTINANAPVDSVNWETAAEFCVQLTRRDQESGVLPAGFSYRLPTESEWEYACRAGTEDATYGNLPEIAWYLDNAGLMPQPVAERAPNAWGFHDMIGNVWEMCHGWFHRQSRRRAARGGSYFNTAACCRAAAREGYSGGRYTGFRVVAARNHEPAITPAADEIPAAQEPPTIHGAILKEDIALAKRIIAERPEALETFDEIPPPQQWCIYNDKPGMLEWLLDQGAAINRPDQDYGATPLICATVMKHAAIVRLLVNRGADTTGAVAAAQKGASGGFENVGLDADGYADMLALLEELGVPES